MTLGEIFEKISDSLSRDEAHYILRECAKFSREEIFAHPEIKISASLAEQIFFILQRRKNHEPLQYIFGKADFFGREFFVGEGVLIPRPETELLVEAALEENFQTFLDWGTGSGCIAATLLCERENCYGVAAEKNPRSLACAWQNFKKLNLLDRCLLWHSQNPHDIPTQTEKKLDLVISNPPYIIRREIKNLMPEVQFEPVAALDGGDDGLDFYRQLLKVAPLWLRGGGRIIFEIGAGQGEFFKQNTFDKMELKYIRSDYAEIERVVCYIKHGY